MTILGLIGERLDEAATPPGQYRKVPPLADSWLADGRPIDAGTAMIIDSNLSHLSYESLRHLVMMPGIGGMKGAGNCWNNLADGAPPAPPAGTTTALEAEISWDRRCARRYGAFPGIQDRAVTTGGAALRSIKFRVYALSGVVTTGTGTLTMYVAVTRSSAPPDLGYLAFEKFNINVTTNTAFEKSLVIPEGLTGGMAAWRCRADTSHGSVMVEVPEFWCWVGALSTHANDVWTSTNVWEYR